MYIVHIYKNLYKGIWFSSSVLRFSMLKYGLSNKEPNKFKIIKAIIIEAKKNL